MPSHVTPGHDHSFSTPLPVPAPGPFRDPRDAASFAPAALGYALFATRWLQAPLYFGLVAAQGVYVYKFFNELWKLIVHVINGHADETYVMLAVLKLVDVVMIANLLIMTIVGGYETFVSRINLQGHRDQPEWLSHVNSNVLKVKLATAIVGISSVHLLQMFVDVHHTSRHALLWGTVIHMAFILSAAILAYMSGPMLESRKSARGCGDHKAGSHKGDGHANSHTDGHVNDHADSHADSHGEGNLPLIPKPSAGWHDDATSAGRAAPSASAARPTPAPKPASASSCGGPGAESRIRAAGFPAPKTLEDFDHDYPRSLDREAVAMLGKLDFITAKENVVLLGPPGTGKTHLAVAFGTRACQAGHQVLFATVAEWVARLTVAKAAGRLTEELALLDRYPLLIVDALGYFPLQSEEAQLLFCLAAHRYERGSLIVTSDKPLGGWDHVLGDTTTASAVIDRLVHHSEIISVEGDNYRMRAHGGFRFASPATR
ncbi:IS21-like element helper ATPase IstB [Streptomyces sp. NBC_01498]|uniref:IS21-like element helper ATPase IstB n=1 Tax=Streptomyces sp. NBC_01498 TaxID=2975870 RepID=UPI002E7C268E|nr:IS21-like element helper ATPase IstB [Streptomyces sp. NBC_01498]WTL26136.1 IS21-like element helper ATPase IstB [Streptomyces sp. NBC_01498]